MSVLIRGIEMPKDCSFCPLISETGCCRAVDELKAEEMASLWTMRERPDWCPLVPVPPHGRLVDADELIAEHNGIFDCCVFPSDIREAPTILEAEP